MNDKKLAVHHIGGRFGNGGLPLLKRFEKDFQRVFYDADADCIGQIKEKFNGSASEIHVLPYCVGRSEGRTRFNITYDPTSSSVFRLNPDYKSFYFFSYNHDFIASDSLHIMEEREVDVVTADGLLEKASDVLPPDFLSMDVQGAEYGILEGARDALNKNVLGLLIETAFHPLYKDQKMFCDVSRFLSDRGFYFVKFLRFMEYSPHRAHIGFRGEGFQIFADALFLRKTESIGDSTENDLVMHTMLRKLAFISIIFNQFEYGLQCLELSRDKKREYQNKFGDICYYSFLEELEGRLSEMAPKYPRIFSEKYTFDVSKRRFECRSSLMEKMPDGKRTLREELWLKYVYPNIYFIADIYEFLIGRIWSGIAFFILPNSPVEKVLRKYGLKKQFRLLKRNRAIQSLFSYKP